MQTGLSQASYSNMQLNAGVFLLDFDYSSATNASTLATLIASNRAKVIGATRGGGTFSCRPSIREIVVDGKRASFVGSEINDGWEVHMSGTMLEITPNSFKNALASADSTTSGNVTTVTVRTEIKSSDYVKICWIGDLADGSLCLIELDNALNVSGASFSFKDKGEGTIPFDFKAHCATVLNQENAPCRIKFFGKST